MKPVFSKKTDKMIKKTSIFAGPPSLEVEDELRKGFELVLTALTMFPKGSLTIPTRKEGCPYDERLR
ncbi:intermembrane space aaa protease iap-1 [Moniliophthora roreri]|nr:intermembrane space aaa protease iap-1 [Moniliophthora roreri]